jgi:hypothetical protein
MASRAQPPNILTYGRIIDVPLLWRRAALAGRPAIGEIVLEPGSERVKP